MKGIYAYNPDYNSLIVKVGDVSILDNKIRFTSNIISENADINFAEGKTLNDFVAIGNMQFTSYFENLKKHSNNSIIIKNGDSWIPQINFTENIDYCGGKNNKALIADMAEAILGAIYLDSNFETVQKICMNLYGNIRDEVLSTDVYNTDYKTRLQEVLQKNGTVNLKYILLDTKGQDNNPVFYSGVYLEDKKLGEGYGKTKKESEQMAAKMALETL